MAVATAFVGCDKLRELQTKPPVVLKSADGKAQITIGPGWKERKELNAEAVLQAAYGSRDMYVVILSENKEDFRSMTLERYWEGRRQHILKGVDKPTETAPVKLTIGGCPAVQSQIAGFSKNDIKLVRVLTIVESPKRYYQIFAWTIGSKFAGNEADLQTVIRSLKTTDDEKK